MRLIRNPIRLSGTYLDILQGKGSGEGWDMSGEVSAALTFLGGVTDPVIFDIGANHGYWTRGMWQALGTGQFFAYEPQEACLPRLKDLAIPKLTIVQKAVADQPGQMNLYSERDGSELASLYERAARGSDTYLDEQIRAELVPVTTIDDEFEAHGLDHIDFMKIDVEGAELRLLSGATHCLSTKAIRAFAFEFGFPNTYSRVFFRDCWDLIAGHGYSLWRIVPGGRLIPVPEYRQDLEHFRGVSNYVASSTAHLASTPGLVISPSQCVMTGSTPFSSANSINAS